MINGFEFSKIKTSRLPESWQQEGALEELESFLQENWQQRSIFYSDGEVTGRQQFIDFDKRDGIKLQNYIGTIIFRGEQLNIFPKVFKEDEDDLDAGGLKPRELIDNLVYWLSYCDKLNFPFVPMKGELSGSEDLMELFITVYAHYVKAVLGRQRYCQYEDIRETGSFVRGRIDFKDYMLRKYPAGQQDKLDFTYSGFVFDNTMNRIIKCTCGFLYNLTKQSANREILRNLLMVLGDVAMADCRPCDCDRVHLSALHGSYRIILSMSRMFLLNKVSSNEIGISDSFCFLFPAEILFEGFIGGFVKEMLAGSARVRTQTGDEYLAELVVDGENLGNAFLLREDILVEFPGSVVILDTKYKEIDRFEKVRENRKLKVSDSDMKQMAVYAAKRGADKLFLIYPLHRNEEPETLEVRFDIHLGQGQAGQCIPLEILKVPFACRENEKETGELLRKILEKVCPLRLGGRDDDVCPDISAQGG